MSIQRQLTRWVWLNHTISQCSNWGKGADHVTIIRSLHSSRIEYHYVHSNTSIQRQLTYWVWGNHTISQHSKWGKGATHVTIIRSLIKDRVSLCALKYLYSKATYILSIGGNHTSSQHSKWEKGATCVTSLIKDRLSLHAHKHVYSKACNLHPENESVAPVHSVASGEKEQIMLQLSNHFTRQG